MASTALLASSVLRHRGGRAAATSGFTKTGSLSVAYNKKTPYTQLKQQSSNNSRLRPHHYRSISNYIDGSTGSVVGSSTDDHDDDDNDID